MYYLTFIVGRGEKLVFNLSHINKQPEPTKKHTDYLKTN